LIDLIDKKRLFEIFKWSLFLFYAGTKVPVHIFDEFLIDVDEIFKF